MCATAGFDSGYKDCDDEGDTAQEKIIAALSASGVYVYNGCLAWYDVSYC